MAAPVAGSDYPGSYAELLAWFADDEACLDYLDWLRWPAGWSCPACGGERGPPYTKIADHGYTHEKTVISATGDPAHVSMPAVHRVASLLKRWLLGTHQGAVGPEHLDAYLNEFTFRFNRRASRRRGLLFYRLLEQAVATGPVTYREMIVTPRPGRRNPNTPNRPALQPLKPHPSASRPTMAHLT